MLQALKKLSESRLTFVEGPPLASRLLLKALRKQDDFRCKFCESLSKNHIYHNNTKFCNKIVPVGGPWPFSEHYAFKRLCNFNHPEHCVQIVSSCAYDKIGKPGVGGCEQGPGGGFPAHLPLISNSGAGQTFSKKKAQTISRRGLSLRTSSAPCMQRWSMPWRLARTCLP